MVNDKLFETLKPPKSIDLGGSGIFAENITEQKFDKKEIFFYVYFFFSTDFKFLKF